MAAFAGIVAPGSAVGEPVHYERARGISGYRPVRYPFAAADSVSPLAGTRGAARPISEPQRRLAGARMPSFADDWYHRIHLLPPRIDLGNVISPIVRRLEVWNAHLQEQTVLAIEATGADGLALSGPPAPPLVFGALQSRTYSFSASHRGTPAINAAFTFRFAGGAEMRLGVTGRRVVVFGIRPDWSDGMTERLEWLSEVLEAHDGSEQRIRLRQLPRRSFEYSWLLEGQDVRLLEHLLFAWGARIYCLPVWTDGSRLLQDVVAGGRQLVVPDAAHSDYHPGGIAVLWRSTAENEAVEIASVDGAALTLTLALGQSWPAGTRVLPARLARLDGTTGVRRLTDTIASGRCRFTVEDLGASSAPEPGTVYRSYSVFDWPPDWSEEIDVSCQRKLTVIDSGTGPRGFDDESGAPQLGRRLTWLLPNRPQITAFRQWLAARTGRVHPCWLPTFTSNLQVSRAVVSGGSGLVVRNTGYSRFVTAHPQRRDLILRTRLGTFFRRVTGAEELSAQEELLSLDQPLDVTVTVDQVLQVSWLELVRLDQDAVELFWETDGVVRVQLSTRTLPS
ncbi:hypothetical protein [Eleftheria terrae]|uniref:hypothetical protein n=1 Tax=Eleftheria terrae TaxID=1597781 RepID=UPI00263AC03D|nr:hypothetical protein [Eleftheria terrae]WKB50772.1 hypothetical protein N7L95_13190 [Eleftheria terrae]